MPHYFFDIEDEGSLPDPEGTNLADLDMARSYAAGLAEVVLAARPNGSTAPWRVIIRGEAGETLDTVGAETEHLARRQPID